MGKEPITSDRRAFVAVGSRPYTEGLCLETIGVENDSRGCISIDESFQSGAGVFYAIGNVIPGPMLAHKAREEGIACVEKLFSSYGHVNYAAIPTIVYTYSGNRLEGRTDEELQKAGVACKKGLFPFPANGRAMALAETVGQSEMIDIVYCPADADCVGSVFSEC